MRTLGYVGRYLGLLLHIGLLIVGSAFLGFWGGSWLDRRLGTSSTFTILGTVLGVISGFWGAYRTIMRISDDPGSRE